IAKLKTEVLEKLATAAWYMHSDRDGKLYFKNVQNLNAKLESLVRAYLPEQAVKELRTRLEALFKPATGWCYQRVLALPALDEIELEQDKVTLVITEPYSGGGLRQEIRDFYEQITWKNRVAFISGPRNTFETLIETGKRLKAIQHIIDELGRDHTPENDPQMVQSKDLADRIRGNFHSAVRETFTILWYPPIADNATLESADFSMRFEGNNYNGEQQILELLKDKQKFTEDIASDTFRKKCESRLFTIQSMPWNEIKKRAAMNSKWQWHLPVALDDLKTSCIQRDIWRENGGYVDKGPFPQPKTRAEVQQKLRDSQTGEATLKVTAVNGDLIYYDYGATASTASARLNGSEFKTKELSASFLVVDSTNVHETGDPVTWKNQITIKYRIFQSGLDRMMELHVAPDAPITYTTDGSDPKLAGATYEGPFVIPVNSQLVLAYAERDDVSSSVERIIIPPEGENRSVQIDVRRPAVWMHQIELKSTRETYECIERARKHNATYVGLKLTIMGESGNNEWIELNTYAGKQISPDLVEECLGVLRKLQGSGQAQMIVESLSFSLGQELLNWVAEVMTSIK
ncbi:glycosyl transferase, partial [bacterium]|nr:glycosyl transferase [bacterium]